MSNTDGLIALNKRLVAEVEKSKKGRELLELLPQGHGSELDADKVDGLHAVEIIAKAKTGAGGGGGGGMQQHGNEYHTPNMAEEEHTHEKSDITDLDCGITAVPEGKSVTKIGFWEDPDNNIKYIKFYDGEELLFTLTFSDAGAAESETWNITRS